MVHANSTFRVPAVATLLTFALALAASCSSGSGDGGGSDGGTDAATGLTFGDSACGACVESGCADAVATCSADPDCAAYYGCLLACSTGPDGNVDAACEAACSAPSSGPGRTGYDALLACRQFGPAAECEACGGAGADAGGCPHPTLCQQCEPSDFPDECGRCWFSNCCDTFDACNDEPECVAIEDCFSDCRGSVTDCFRMCFQQHPTFIREFLEDTSCFGFFCEEPCGTDQQGLSQQCADCVTGPCAPTRLDCEADEECFLLNLCADECDFETNCVQGCKDRTSADSLALWEAARLCSIQKCDGACGGI